MPGEQQPWYVLKVVSASVEARTEWNLLVLLVVLSGLVTRSRLFVPGSRTDTCLTA